MSELKVISIEELKNRSQGTVIEISDWVPGSKIGVRVKAIDMTPHIMAMESMPNMLKVSANEVFNGKLDSKNSKKAELITDDFSLDDMAVMVPVMDKIVAEVLVEPTYAQIQEVCPLTLTQKLEIFHFAMGGVEQLDSFRKKTE